MPDERIPDPTLALAMEHAVARLAPREQAAIRLRFHHDLRLHDVAEWLGVTDSRASQIVSDGLHSLRAPLAA